MKLKAKFRILEFVIFGVVTSVIENLISLHFFGDKAFGLQTFFLLVLLVIPFAILEEIIVDHPRFWIRVCKACGIKVDEKDHYE